MAARILVLFLCWMPLLGCQNDKPTMEDLKRLEEYIGESNEALKEYVDSVDAVLSETLKHLEETSATTEDLKRLEEYIDESNEIHDKYAEKRVEALKEYVDTVLGLND